MRRQRPSSPMSLSSSLQETSLRAWEIFRTSWTGRFSSRPLFERRGGGFTLSFYERSGVGRRLGGWDRTGLSFFPTAGMTRRLRGPRRGNGSRVGSVSAADFSKNQPKRLSFDRDSFPGRRLDLFRPSDLGEPQRIPLGRL